MRRTWLLLLPGLLLPRPAAGQTYSVVDLGVGASFFPTALNNRGQILLTDRRRAASTIGALQEAGSPSQ
jgi:hypothetical protein